MIPVALHQGVLQKIETELIGVVFSSPTGDKNKLEEITSAAGLPRFFVETIAVRNGNDFRIYLYSDNTRYSVGRFVWTGDASAMSQTFSIGSELFSPGTYKLAVDFKGHPAYNKKSATVVLRNDKKELLASWSPTAEVDPIRDWVRITETPLTISKEDDLGEIDLTRE